jgi:hypothetical protein
MIAAKATAQRRELGQHGTLGATRGNMLLMRALGEDEEAAAEALVQLTSKRDKYVEYSTGLTVTGLTASWSPNASP